MHGLSYNVSAWTRDLTRILTRSGNFWRNTPSNTRLTVRCSHVISWEVGERHEPFSVSREKGLVPCDFRDTFEKERHLSLSSRRRALRGIPPLVQPLPFATCRRRSVRERILACLRHFSKKRLARSVPRQPDRERQRATSFHYCDYFMKYRLT